MFSAFQTFGKLGALASSVARAWSPLALWPNGAASPGMWIDPSLLTASFNDYTGTTPVATPGTVADSANPVGLALDIRAGAPDTLGPELVVNGDFSDGTTGWTPNNATLVTDTSIFPAGGAKLTSVSGVGAFAEITASGLTVGDWYLSTVQVYLPATNATPHCATLSGPGAHDSGKRNVPDASVQEISYAFVAVTTTQRLAVSMVNPGVAWSTPGDVVYITNLTCKQIPGNHMLQATAAARPLESAYDGQTLGPGNTYDATGYPIFQLYDGTDDGMATASFAAGTLINGMDCMIVVRRDSSAKAMIGLTFDGNYFGNCEAGWGSACFGGCGTPTVWVDGVQLAGSTSVTADTLNSAVTVGDFHIVEFRDLSLSTWTRLQYSQFGGYLLNGARGDILLYPSTASTEDKDAARQWLADYYGVTLP